MRGRGMMALLIPLVIPLVVLLVVLLGGCATQTTTIGGRSYPAVPEPMPETMPKPPVSAETLLWQPGYWDWTGPGYVWRPGQYVPAAGHGNLWMQGHWTETGGGWVWRPPHWTS